MERVAFMIEETHQVLRCMLNPETLVMRRTAGVRPRHSAGGPLTGAGLADDPLLYTGGGRTVLELDLLFDLELSHGKTAGNAAAGGSASKGVRALTAPLWQMAENTRQSGRSTYNHPAQVRFLWGKAWNVPAVVLSVAERLERFTPQGAAQRSWLRLRLLRVNETTPQPRARTSFTLADVPPPSEASTPDEMWHAYEPVQGERLEQIAAREYGDSAFWRLIAAANNLDSPSDVKGLLLLPPKPQKGTHR